MNEKIRVGTRTADDTLRRMAASREVMSRPPQQQQQQTRLTLVPSYGRDYKTRDDVEAAWAAGKDFTICDVSSCYNCAQISNRDATIGMILNIRYKRLTRVHTIEIK